MLTPRVQGLEEEVKNSTVAIMNILATLKEDIAELGSSVTKSEGEMKSNYRDLMEDVNSLNTTLCSKLENQAEIIAATYDAVKTCTGTDVEESEETYTCGDTGGWRRVIYLDMTDHGHACPSGWSLTSFSKRTCGRVSTGGLTCDPVIYQVIGGEYSKVCGRARGYQFGAPLAFYAYTYTIRRAHTIDDAYVSGLSITHGTPRQHIWTYAAGITEPQYQAGVSTCPCGTTSFAYWQSLLPPFVGTDYFCESGLNEPWSFSLTFHPDDPLWDGENCVPTSTCCSYNSPPYFTKELPSSTNDDIEIRLCNYHNSGSSDVPIELIELYVQ